MVLTEALASGLPVMSTDSVALDGVESCAIMRLPYSGKAGDWAEVLRGWLSEHARQHPPSAGPAGASKRAHWRRYWLGAKRDASVAVVRQNGVDETARGDVHSLRRSVSLTIAVSE